MSSISSIAQDMTFVDPSDMDTSSSASASPTLPSRPLADATEEHPQYHFHDGSLAFELEGVKYRVHSSLLARHCGFASTWAQDLHDPTAAGISRAGIEAFLSMIYLATYEYPNLKLSITNWSSILHLATKWKADGMRALAIKKLSTSLSAFDKLLLCRKYDVPEWLASSCAALALRSSPLTMDEAEQLTKSDIVRVFLAREAVAKGGLAATEEAISAWISGFLSKSEQAHPSAPAAATAAPASQSSAVTAPAPTEFAPPGLSSRPGLRAAADVSDMGESRTPSPKASATAILSQTQSDVIGALKTPHAFLAAGPSEASSTYTAEGAVRPSGSASAEAADPFLPSEAGHASDDGAFVPVQVATDAIAPVRTASENIVDAVEAIRAQRYDEALNSITLDNLKTVAGQVASSLITQNPQRPGVFDTKRLQLLLRAVMHRVVTSPSFIPCGAQFVAALSTRSSLKGVRFEIVLHDDMQSLSSRWAAFRAGGQPAVDHGGVMVDLSSNPRSVYSAQMGHGKGFFRTLVRLGVLPATNKYVEMLVKSYPLVLNP